MPRRAGQRPTLGRLAPATLLALGAAVAAAFTASPWPAALLIRSLFERDARRTVAEMTPYAPASGIAQRLDVRTGDEGAPRLDVFHPERGDESLPTVVWIHGGAWISGFKEDVRPYLRMIAARGYTTVGLDYTVSPGARYPTALAQLDASLRFLLGHADEHRIDPARIVLAGDSAGANLASQLAALTTDPAYAAELGLDPALRSEQLRGVILNCGIYDVSGIPNAPGIAGWGFRVALWAYLGRRDWSSTAGARQMSTLDHLTGAFPPAWISGGNGDPLTTTQSRPMAERLTGLGVGVTTLFYPDDHEPRLPHEYQFHLRYADARAALDATLEWLGDTTR